MAKENRNTVGDAEGKLTTAAGAPVPDNQNVQTAGPRGPMLLQDVWFLEKLAHFDREVIPELRMHANGSGAFGTFTVTNDITRFTNAKIFSEVGKKTEMFARFSAVAGERGAAEVERDICGFAVVLYRGWKLGSCREQHSRLLLPRPTQVPGPQPRGQARPPYQYA